MTTVPNDETSPEGAVAPGSSRRIPASIVALVIVFAVFTAFVAVGSSPRVCSSCHSAQARALQADTHSTSSCYSCHLEQGAWGFTQHKTAELVRMYPRALLGKGLVRPAVQLPRSSCLQCHQPVLSTLTASNGIRIQHASCANGPTCDECHSNIGHGEAVRWQARYSMGDCTACHDEQHAPTECDTCHAESGRRAKIRGAWQVTHGPDWKKTHGMGDQDSCSSCHPADFCKRCHKVEVPHSPRFGADHGTAAIEDKSACLVCHKSEKDFCEPCHTMPMPHPSGFLRSHSSTARNRNDTACFVCHVDTDCDACHAFHVHPGGGQGVPVPWGPTPEELRP